MTEKRKFVYSIKVPVRWYDMDAFGHVNNSIYFTFFEQVRFEWWRTFAPELSLYSEEGPVIINAQCTFQKAILYPATVEVKAFVGAPGRSSFEIYYEIYDADKPGLMYAHGSTKVVWVNRLAEKSMPLPEFMRKQLPNEL